MSAPVNRDDYRAEARELVDWLHAQARIYTANAPALTEDIRRFEDAAALLDAFQAGLVPVPPHPLMRAELVQWVDPEQALPQPEEEVMLFTGQAVEFGYLGEDKKFWFEFGYFDRVDAWAPLPRGPVPAPTPESRHDEEDASCA